MTIHLSESDLTRNRSSSSDALLEAARLGALDSYRVLDRALFAPLERLAEQAAESFGAERAAVAFVDGAAVWLAGAWGFDVARTGRADSFCDSVVRNGVPLLVDDAARDSRFAGHEMVQELRIRSYAGAPLVDGEGYVLGTIALFSGEVGAFGPDVLHDLSRLSRMVVGFLSGLRPRAPAPVPGRQGWLGVRTLGSRSGVAEPGLIVLSVAKGGPADLAGLRPADILHAIDGVPLSHPSDIVTALADMPPEATVTMRFRRAGQWREATASVRLARRRRVAATSDRTESVRPD